MCPADNNHSLSLRRSLTLITLGGCLAMVYSTAVSSPAITEFLRDIGANEFDFGLLGGIPLVMLFLQFVGAVIAHRVRRRKPLFVVLTLLSRLLYIPVAIVPLLFPGLRNTETVALIIVLVALGQAMTNFIVPMWFSWMGDLVPEAILNRFWGSRYRWQQMTWTAAYLGVAALTYFAHLPIRTVFPITIAIGCVAGVVDALLFIRVDEPVNPAEPGQRIRDILVAPLRHPDYRSFVRFSCVWTAVVSLFAPFMQLYFLKVLGLGVWKTTLVWCVYGIGNALTARTWAVAADRYGYRPILVVCMVLKPLVVLGLLLATPGTALWLCAPVFFLDSMLNAGMAIASNGYMLSLAPPRDRSMYVAAITGLAGICGGIATLAAGSFLQTLSGFSITLFGRTWNNFHLLFAICLVLRILCVPLARRIRQPHSASPRDVVEYVRDTAPIRYLFFFAGRRPRDGRGPGDGDAA